MKHCDTKETSKCNKHGRYKIQPGWTQKWISPKDSHVHEIVRGPFFSPRLLKTFPFVAPSQYKPRKMKYDQSIIRHGIPDPWIECLVLKGMYGLVNKRKLEKSQVPSCWRLHITEKMWQKFGVPLIQGIPDPLKNLSISQQLREMQNKHLCKTSDKSKKQKLKSKDPLKISEKISKNPVECEKKISTIQTKCKSKYLVSKVNKSTSIKSEIKTQSKKNSLTNVKAICGNCSWPYFKITPHERIKCNQEFKTKETRIESGSQNHRTECNKVQSKAQLYDGTICIKNKVKKAKPKKSLEIQTKLESQEHCPKCNKVQYRVEPSDRTICVNQSISNLSKNEIKTVYRNKSDFETITASSQDARKKIKKKKIKDDKNRQTDSGELADISETDSISKNEKFLNTTSATLSKVSNIQDLKNNMELFVSDRNDSDIKMETKKCNSMQSIAVYEEECKNTKLKETLQKSKICTRNNNILTKHCYLKYCNPHFNKSHYSTNSISDVSCEY